MSREHTSRADKSGARESSPSDRSHRASFGPPHAHRFDHSDACPEIVARLEWLDDLMFAAIEGEGPALEKAIDAWHKTREELGPSTLEESRQQYLRRAQTVWASLRNDDTPPPQRVFAAIELISLLADKGPTKT